MAQSNHHKLAEGSVRESLIRMTTPMIIGMLMMFTFNIVDTLFISFLGTDPLTAISFTFPVGFTILSLAIGLGIGASAVVAKYLGRGEIERAKEAATVINYISATMASLMIVLCWIFLDEIFRLLGAGDDMLVLIREFMVVWLPGSLLIVCMMTGNAILRAGGNTKTPSMLMAFAGFSNAVLDPLLIFGLGPFPALGIQGAAWATVISWAMAFAYLYRLLIFKQEMISRKFPSPEVMATSGREMLRIGIPAAGANMMTPIAAGVMTAIAAGFGNSAVAAFGVGGRIEPIATLLVLAISTSLPPLISQNYGAGHVSRVAEAYRIAIRFVLVWQLLIYGVLALLAPVIAEVFSDDPEVISTIRLFLWILPLGYGMQGVIILTNSSLNALHQPMSALWLSIARFFVFYVPLAWLGSVYFGLWGFFGGAVAGNLLMGLISLATFNRAVNAELRLQEKTA
ncbi:MAG: MATE family efflux transporter [Gammaproteobacteria bacterium]|nr:MATE family efflux transporter [Gammaproteobacteria bacterium]